MLLTTEESGAAGNTSGELRPVFIGVNFLGALEINQTLATTAERLLETQQVHLGSFVVSH